MSDSSAAPPTRLIAGPFNRVEGDLEVTLDIADGRVRAARVNATLFRGIERILEGRDPMDALVIAPRICGICSVSQSRAAAVALAGLSGERPPPNGRIAANLILATENLADHLTHFHLFFMPDFAREAYGGRRWSGAAQARFTAAKGSAIRSALRTRAELLHVMGLLAGHWPHTLALRPGGVTCGIETEGCARLAAIVASVRADLEETLFGAPLETVLELADYGDLDRWRRHGPAGDFRLFLDIASDLDLEALGRGWDRFLTCGAWSGGGRDATDETRLWPAGTVADGALLPFDGTLITEDHASSHLQDHERPHAPFEGSTIPRLRDGDAYSWCKAPRLGGRPFETGAIARQLVAGQPLVRALAGRAGGNVFSRVIARLMEIAALPLLMERWVGALRPGEKWCHPDAPVPDGQAVGFVEAARGTLGHWLRVGNGRITGYQIVAPTTWNFSPRDADGVPGPLERALEGAPVLEGERTPLAVQHIVRSFDPCMACTVH